MSSPAGRARAISARIEEVDRPEIWISRVEVDELEWALEVLNQRQLAGDHLPLAGLTFAVKDNIDVAGVVTTAGCPAFATLATSCAPAVQSLLDAGAIYVGKTNLDQFATGLVGTRSPYGAVRNAVDPQLISGGSSSGSAVAVALGLVDFALGTDTAGSGRVPAALNGIVGVKPTVGMVSTTGVVPACWSFDCVTAFTRDVVLARRVMRIMADTDRADPRRRHAPCESSLGLAQRPVVAFVEPVDLPDLDSARREAYDESVQRLRRANCDLIAVDLEPFLRAGRLLYGGAFVAERFAAVGDWVASHRDDVDPTVKTIIMSAGELTAQQLATDTNQLALATREVAEIFSRIGACSFILPTVGFFPTLDEVAADPVGVNARLGRYTTFVNMLDLCAMSVPGPTVAGLPFGLTLMGPAWSDEIQGDLAQIIEGRSRHQIDTTPIDNLGLPFVEIAVVGAHLRGQPLNYQLTDRGGRFVRRASTAPQYRLFALQTEPPKPGLVRVNDAGAGAAIALEIWALSPADFADFVTAIGPPMVVGSIELAERTRVSGFLCEPIALEGALDITASGGWRAHLASSAQ